MLKVSEKDLATLYTEVYNLFEGVDKRSLVDYIRGRRPESKLLNRQRVLLMRLVEMIDSGLDEPSNLSAKLQPIEIKEDNVLKILAKKSKKV